MKRELKWKAPAHTISRNAGDQVITIQASVHTYLLHGRVYRELVVVERTN
jgi:hypothetical protein